MTPDGETNEVANEGCDMARGRKPQVTYWQSKGGYGFNFEGKPYVTKGPQDEPHGSTYTKAVALWAQLTTGQATRGTNDHSVSACVDAYRAHMQRTKMTNVGTYEGFVRSFVEMYGKLRAGELQPCHVTHWLDGRADWGDTTKRNACQVILAVFRYCVREGHVAGHPFLDRTNKPSILMPSATTRGREALFSEEFEALLFSEEGKRQNEAFYRVMWALSLTGARPGEIIYAESHNYGDGMLTYRGKGKIRGYVWKNAKKTEENRHVHLTPELREYVEACCMKHPDGPIFRTASGKPWSHANLAYHLDTLTSRPAVIDYMERHVISVDDVKLYNFRHTWITKYVERTGDIWGAARMCGTSVKMIEDRYAHPDVAKLHQTYQRYMAGQ